MGGKRSRAAQVAGLAAVALLLVDGGPRDAAPSPRTRRLAPIPPASLHRAKTVAARAPAFEPGSESAVPGDEGETLEHAAAGAANAPPSPWWLEPGPAVEVRIGRHVRSAAAARLDGAALEAVAAGDEIRLALPEVGALDVVIQRIAMPAPGVRQLQGHLADPVEDYPVALTLGPVLAFANVTTPTGSWIAEFEHGVGWVLYDDLEDQLVDHSQTDERIPPLDEGAG